jgi:uncharacterized RDD family membrane protein YckC
MAAIVDVLVVAALEVALYLGVAAFVFAIHPGRFHWPSWLGWSLPFGWIVMVVPYLTFCWATTGRTVGNSLLGLRVVNHAGRRMGVPLAAARALACAIFPIFLLWVAISSSNRSIQDVVFRTSVVYDWSPSASLFDRRPANGD